MASGGVAGVETPAVYGDPRETPTGSTCIGHVDDARMFLHEAEQAARPPVAKNGTCATCVDGGEPALV